MQEPITINGLVVERSEALETVKEAVKVIRRKLSNAQASTLEAARQLAAVKYSEAYFALLTDEELEATNASKTAWAVFYRKCGLNASKASRLAVMATIVDSLIAKGIAKGIAEAVSQDTARAVNRAVKVWGWKKVVKKLKKLQTIDTPTVDGLFAPQGTQEVEDIDAVLDAAEGTPPNTPTDTPTDATFNDRLEAVEAVIRSDKPIDHATIDYDLLEVVISDLQAVLENRPTN